MSGCSVRQSLSSSQFAPTGCTCTREFVGTTASVISRLEDADYEGHSLAMLNRIAAALNKRVKIEFVPLTRAGPKRRKSA